MKKIIIVGAGVAGRLLKSDIESGDDKNELSVIGFIDDSIGKGVIGRFADIPKILEKSYIDELVIALPSERGKVIRKVLLHKSEYPNVYIKILPRATDVVVGGEVSYSMVRSLDLTDIVGERLDRRMHEEIASEIKDKVVMITGGGGSIGSEIVKQIFLAAPKKVIIIDSCELNLFDISNSIERLQHNSPQSTTEFVLGNVLNTALMDRLFAHNNIDYVFHAAAYKHVPIVEVNAYEGLANNFYATYQLAELAQKYKVPKFILISTDKAVEPSSVMGYTKRMCEKYLLALNNNIVICRFGNIIGSSGSVIEIFEKQAQQGVITVTHKEMERYFISVEEAVSNLILSSNFNSGLYIFNMGNPLKIMDIAKTYKDTHNCKIDIIGLREGEKLKEKLHYDFETINSTIYSNIFEVITPINSEDKIKINKLALYASNYTKKELINKFKEINNERNS
jgi:FlaA1/EpsC-like NDP-sugar epimerase